MEQKNIIRETISFTPHAYTSSAGIRSIFSCNCPDSINRPDFPQQYGEGYVTCKKLNPFMELWADDLHIHCPCEMTGVCKGNFYCASFCLSEGLEWEEHVSHTHFKLKKEQGAFYHINHIKEICSYDAGQHLQSVCLMIHPERLQSIIAELSLHTNLFQYDYSNFKLSYFSFPRETTGIIKQLTACPYISSLRTLYIEGKVTELLALSLYQLCGADAQQCREIKLSKTDLSRLSEARGILDASLSKPISIRDLSRLVGLNEYKLKKGFTQLYGLPVHTYLIEERMQKARELLERQSGSVTEIAEYVGYSCPSSFSKAFRKRYGFNPSECY